MRGERVRKGEKEEEVSEGGAEIDGVGKERYSQR
jgi:hypothetical protein